MIGHIDGDIIVYAVAGVCEGNKWVYKGETFDSKLLLNQVLKDDGVDDSCITHYKEPEPWEKCRDSIISYLEEIIEHLDCDYKVYLSGKGNFRYEKATIQPYKGNRVSLSKPFHYDSARQLLVDVYNAEVSSGIEADDLIGLSHDPEKDCIVTLDKDLNCIPGLHYNWKNKQCYWVKEVDADRSFYSQVLTGDSTDNILGLYGVGAKSAAVKQVSSQSSDREMFDTVRKEYQSRFGSYWKQFMSENCELLWILQKREPSWRKYIEQEEN